MFEKRIRQGHKITAAQRALAEKAIEKGEEPPSLKGRNIGRWEDLSFDYEKYENPGLKRIGINLQLAGEENSITPQILGSAQQELVRLCCPKEK